MAFPVVAFPDAVALAKTYLDDHLGTYGYGSIPVHKNVPNPRPALFVRMFRSGGPKANHVTDQAQLSIEVWGDDDTAVADLAGVVRGLALSMRGEVVDGAQVYRVDEFSGPADLPDPVSDQPRLTWTVSVWIRGSTAA